MKCSIKHNKFNTLKENFQVNLWAAVKCKALCKYSKYFYKGSLSPSLLPKSRRQKAHELPSYRRKSLLTPTTSSKHSLPWRPTPVPAERQRGAGRCCRMGRGRTGRGGTGQDRTGRDSTSEVDTAGGRFWTTLLQLSSYFLGNYCLGVKHIFVVLKARRDFGDVFHSTAPQDYNQSQTAAYHLGRN